MPNGKPTKATLVVEDAKGVTTKITMAISKTANAKHYTVTPATESDTIEAYGKLYLKP